MSRSDTPTSDLLDRLQSFDPRTLPEMPLGRRLRQVWDDTFGMSPELMPPKFILPDPDNGWTQLSKPGSSAKSCPSAGAPLLGSHNPCESSLNWSGAYLLPTSGKRFVQVWGEWVVPAIQAPEDKDPEAEYQCSTWIGLDGQRQYANSTLPQIGTLQKVKGAKQQTTAWVQWWQRGNKRSLPVTLDFSVEVGNRISCVLTVLAKRDDKTKQYKQSALFNIVNHCTKKHMAMEFNPPTERASKAPVWISGATAAWVMERPAVLKNQTLRQLAKYSTTSFGNCIAAETTEADSSPDEPTPRDLESPWFIRMYEVRDKPGRIAYISTPKPRRSTSFDVTYGG